MRRVVMVLLLVVGSSAQDDDAALNPDTPPGDRQELIREAVSTPEGAARMAKHLEDPKVHAAIKHQIVEELFDANKAIAHLESITLLLLGDGRLARQVRWMFRRAADDPAVAGGLMKRLQTVVDGTNKRAKDVRVRQATAVGLSLIASVDAVRLIIDLWASAKDPVVKAECQRRVTYIIPAVGTPGAAHDYLTLRSRYTYWDLRDDAQRYLRAEIDRLKHYKKVVLSDVNARECFEFLDGSDAEAKRTVSKRLVELAKQKQFAPLEVNAFADGLLHALEIERNDPDVVASLVSALKVLLNGGKSPLADPKRMERLVAAVRPVAARPDHWATAGLACVELLFVLGGESAANLAPFAGARAAAVRSAAVDKLGSLARQRAELRGYIGGEFARRLVTENDAGVRRRLLFNLIDAPVDEALPSLEKLLVGGKLTPAEVEYGVEVLGKLRSAESLQTLLKLARGGPDERVRLTAVRMGLLARRVSPEENTEILKAIEAMALSDKEPIPIRQGLIKALGDAGGREAYEVLDRIGRIEALREDVGRAKLAIAERLAKNARGLDDLRVAARALHEFAGGEFAALDRLAQTIFKTAAERKLKTEATRLYHARLYATRTDVKRSEVLAIYKDAADNASTDGLSHELRAELCTEYKTLLLKPPAKPTQADLAEAIACLNKLAELAGKNDAEAAVHLLEAAGIAIRLKDRQVAEQLLAQAEKKGAAAERVEALRKAIAALPKKPS